MKIRFGVVSRLILFLSVFFIVLSIGVTGFIYINQKNVLMETVLAQSKLLTETYAQASADAMEVKDDILLISYMERLKKIPDCRYAMILDPSGKVLIHTDSAKVREKLTDELTTRALGANETIVQETEGDDGLIHDIATPVNINFKKVATMRIGFSPQSVYAQLDNYRQQATLIVILMIVLTVIGVFLASINISRGFSDLNSMIEAFSKGKYNEKLVFNRDDEISDIMANIQKAMTEAKAVCDSYEDKISAMERARNYFIGGFAQFFPQGLIVLNDQNKLLHINSQAASIVGAGSTELLDKHILEITRSSEIMGLLADSEKQPNTIITQFLPSLNTKASICTITDNMGRERVGTIILLEYSAH